MKNKVLFIIFILVIYNLTDCKRRDGNNMDNLLKQKKSLVSDIFTADPSAHVFNDKIYIYTSHDIDAGVNSDVDGSQFDMRDYHVLSISDFNSPVIDHGAIIKIEDIPWVKKQLWAPDAAFKDNKYYLFFPAKDKNDIFRIGVAISDSPEGPFKAEPEPIKGSFSIDPAVFVDDDERSYIYFGGIWGGQLDKWQSGKFDPENSGPTNYDKAVAPRMAKLTDDMLGFSEPVKEILIMDEKGDPILEGDKNKRFFEAPWVHKYNGKYYFSYSTGDTHYIVYAVGDSPYGPFTYTGRILNPVLGWTTHHSIVEFQNKWYLFYHDCEISKGVTHLRNVKFTELTHNKDGSIEIIEP